MAEFGELTFLRIEAENMRHAIVRDVIWDANGKVIARREHHYLTCRKCELLARIAQIESEGTQQ